jgi:hypothetical protein
MATKKDKNLLYLEDFLIAFAQTATSSLSCLEGKHTNSEIELFINKYLQLCYRIFNNDNVDDTINDFLNHEPFIDAVGLKLSDNRSNDHLYKFSFLVTSQLLNTILLYKKGYLPSMTQSPLNFIKDILLTTLPIQNGKKEVINNELRIALNAIDQSIWYYINQKPYADISIVYWVNFDKCPEYTHYNLSEAIDLVSKIVKPTPKYAGYEDRFCDFEPDPQDSLNYNSYFKKLDDILQNSFKKPDIIFIDTSLISEYKNKGVIISYDSIEKQHDHESMFWEDSLLHIGSSLDRNTLDVFPISRNFHIPAKGQKNDIDITELTIAKISDSFKELYKNFSQIKNTDEQNIRKLFTKDFDKSVEIKNFIIYTLPQSKFIPLQFARGAHAVYSFFAYTANCTASQNSFIDIELTRTPSSETTFLLSLFPKEALNERLTFFYQLAFNYIPVISLILDHKYSGFVRDTYSENWFDSCLPIEASIFQKTKIIFSKNSFKAECGNPLSCLGGFALAITHDCTNPYKAAGIMKNISSHRVPIFNTIDFDEITEQDKVVIKNELNKFKDQKVFQTIILPEQFMNKEFIKSEILEEYLKTPEKCAIRPNFKGWKELEMLISDTIRLNFISLSIFRNVVLAFSNKKTELENFSFSDEEIENIIDNYKTIIYEELKNRNIAEFFIEHGQINNQRLTATERRDLSKEILKDVKDWIINSFKFSIIEKVYIKDMVTKMLKIYSDNGREIAPSLLFLANKTTDALYSKIDSFSYFNNYLINPTE